jgi:hypothetical protein
MSKLNRSFYTELHSIYKRGCFYGPCGHLLPVCVWTARVAVSGARERAIKRHTMQSRHLSGMGLRFGRGSSRGLARGRAFSHSRHCHWHLAHGLTKWKSRNARDAETRGSCAKAPVPSSRQIRSAASTLKMFPGKESRFSLLCVRILLVACIHTVRTVCSTACLHAAFDASGSSLE